MSAKKYRDKETEFNLSNKLIESKYKLSPFSKDIMNLAITRIEKTNNPDIPLKADLYNVELFRIFGYNKRNNIKRELEKASNEIQNCKIVIEDSDGGFDSYVIAPTCRYHEGVFTIQFNASLRNHTVILNNTQYTQLSVISSSLLKSFYSKRLYEILKEEYYKLNPKDLQDCVIKRINLSELRFIIGLADQSESAVDKYIRKCKREKIVIDWDYAYYELCTTKSHDRWDSFKTRILERTKKEMESYTEIRFEYEALSSKHNKVFEIEFTIYPNQPSTEVIVERQRKMQAVKEGESDFYKQQNLTDYWCRNILEEFSDHKELFGSDEISLFMKDADGDEELVRWAIMDTDRYGKTNVINNYIACVRDRIHNPSNYKKPICVVDGDIDKGDKLVGIIEDYKDNKDDTALRVWNKAKAKPEFSEFVQYLAENNLTVEMFEDIYEPKEYFAEYTRWKQNR